jgi:hypothetical protein
VQRHHRDLVVLRRVAAKLERAVGESQRLADVPGEHLLLRAERVRASELDAGRLGLEDLGGLRQQLARPGGVADRAGLRADPRQGLAHAQRVAELAQDRQRLLVACHHLAGIDAAAPPAHARGAREHLRAQGVDLRRQLRGAVVQRERSRTRPAGARGRRPS